MIQNVGLFPHQTIRANVGTVPRLLGWPKDRIRARVDELLDLVGLDPAGTASATRTSSPAASASGSGWPGRSPPTRWCC